MPPAVYLDEDFVDVKDIAVASMLSFQAAGINGAEFDAPQADRFAADGDPSFSQQVFDVAVAQIEAIVEPDGVGNNVWWESVAFVGVHLPSLPKSTR